MNDMDFETWYDIYMDECRKLNYVGRFDRESAYIAYDDDRSPEFAADQFVKEING